MKNISPETFFGGARSVDTNTVLRRGSSRVISCRNVSSIDVLLPDPEEYRVDEHGGAHFYILRHGSTVVVKDHEGSTITTLSAGAALELFLSETGWVAVARAIGGSGTFSSSPRAALEPTLVDGVPASSCFEGSLCELASALGVVPLDGREGRAKCIVPMCQDVVQHARNHDREPIRAADIVMPSVIPVQFFRDEFTPDSNHPLASTVLPEEFFLSLYNNDRPHGLVYIGRVDGRSRHPHHLRISYESELLSWLHGPGDEDLDVTRHVWGVELEYTLPNEDVQSLFIFFVAEHTLPSEPGPNPAEEPGGQQAREVGAWGTIFSLYVFCNGLVPDFADNDEHTPAGASGPIEFTMHDPFVSGGAYDVGVGSAADKWCHPQMVLAGHLPMTFHAPMGYQYIPWEDRKWLKSFKGSYDLPGKNRPFCYKVRNGSPWLDTSGCSESYPRDAVELDDVFRNIVFGWDVGNVNGAGMSLGGGFPSSRPIEFIVWENGGGTGQTWLKPTRPGWNEDCGVLDVENGSSGSIAICTDDRHGLDDGTGRRYWPGAGVDFDFEECDGHPDEPFEGVGGGHTVFNNGNSHDGGNIQSCCLSVGEWAVAEVTDWATRTTTTFGDQVGGECEVESVECESSGSFWTQAVLEYEDHTYVMNGDQANRTITWLRLLPDPDNVPNDYTHTGTDSKFSVNHGTWDDSTAVIDVTATTHPSTVKALLLHDDVGDPVESDVTVVAKFLNAQEVTQALCSKVTMPGGQISGYFARLRYTSGDDGFAEIVKIIGDAETVIASLALSDFSDDEVECQFQDWGTEKIFTWIFNGGTQRSLTAEDCELATGQCGLAMMSSGMASFEDVSVTDEEKFFQEITGQHGPYLNDLDWPLTIPAQRKSYVEESESYEWNPECGECCEPPRCNCTNIFGSVHTSISATWTGLDVEGGRDTIEPVCSDAPPNYGVNGDNPSHAGSAFYRCDCEGEWCPGEEWFCGECPAPWRCMTLSLPRAWPESREPYAEPRMCRGLSKDCLIALACP